MLQQNCGSNNDFRKNQHPNKHTMVICSRNNRTIKELAQGIGNTNNIHEYDTMSKEHNEFSKEILRQNNEMIDILKEISKCTKENTKNLCEIRKSLKAKIRK